MKHALRKKPLGVVLPGYSYFGFAVAASLLLFKFEHAFSFPDILALRALRGKRASICSHAC